MLLSHACDALLPCSSRKILPPPPPPPSEAARRSSSSSTTSSLRHTRAISRSAATGSSKLHSPNVSTTVSNERGSNPVFAASVTRTDTEAGSPVDDDAAASARAVASAATPTSRRAFARHTSTIGREQSVAVSEEMPGG